MLVYTPTDRDFSICARNLIEFLDINNINDMDQLCALNSLWENTSIPGQYHQIEIRESQRRNATWFVFYRQDKNNESFILQARLSPSERNRPDSAMLITAPNKPSSLYQFAYLNKKKDNVWVTNFDFSFEIFYKELTKLSS